MENENQVLLLLGEIKGQLSTFVVSQADHEARLRVLETNATKQKGVFAGITIAASAVASVVGFVAHFFYGKYT